MLESTVRARADRSWFKTPSTPSCERLWLKLKVTDGPSASQWRTSCRSTCLPHQKQQSFYPRIFNRKRTVRPSKFGHRDWPTKSVQPWTQPPNQSVIVAQPVRVRWQTVCTSWVDRPPVKTFGHSNQLQCSPDVRSSGLSASLGRTIHSSTWNNAQILERLCLSSNTKLSDCLPPSCGLSAGPFPAKPILSKMLITFSSVNQIRWSWTLWKAYSEHNTIQLNKGSKTKWINPEIHSKIQPIVRNTTKTLFPKYANSKWSPMGWSKSLSLS